MIKRIMLILNVFILCSCSVFPKIPNLINELDNAIAFNDQNGVVAFKVFQNVYLSVDIDIQNQDTKTKYRIDTDPPTISFLSTVLTEDDPNSICKNIALFEIPSGRYKIVFMQISKNGRLAGSEIESGEFVVASGQITSFGIIQMTVEEDFMGQSVKSVTMKTVDSIPESEFKAIKREPFNRMQINQEKIDITGT